MCRSRTKTRNRRSNKHRKKKFFTATVFNLLVPAALYLIMSSSHFRFRECLSVIGIMRNSHRKASLHGLYKGFLIFLASITTIWDNTAKKQRSRMMSHSCHLAFFVILLLEPFLQGPANCGLKVHSSSLVHLLRSSYSFGFCTICRHFFTTLDFQ